MEDTLEGCGEEWRVGSGEWVLLNTRLLIAWRGCCYKRVACLSLPIMSTMRMLCIVVVYLSGRAIWKEVALVWESSCMVEWDSLFEEARNA